MIIRGKRAIAYFDILGFKSKIDDTPIEELANNYERIVAQTDREFTVKDGMIVGRQVCYRYIFSDSLFLVAKEDSEDSFIDLISYAWRMMQQFIVSGFPLRGAITYGDVYVNFDSNIFLGKAISEAVVLEGQQDWIGAIVSDSVIDRYKNIFITENNISGVIMNFLMPVYAVPFKDGVRKNFHVINWRQNMISQQGIKILFKNEPYNESVQIKINNTLEFSKEVVDSGRAYFNDGNIPQRYRKLYIGNGAPPANGLMFTNGDEY